MWSGGGADGDDGDDEDDYDGGDGGGGEEEEDDGGGDGGGNAGNTELGVGRSVLSPRNEPRQRRVHHAVVYPLDRNNVAPKAI